MQDIVNACVNNGLGVASFIALIIFIFKYQSKANDTLENISKTLTELSERINKLEQKDRNKGE